MLIEPYAVSGMLFHVTLSIMKILYFAPQRRFYPLRSAGLQTPNPFSLQPLPFKPLNTFLLTHLSTLYRESIFVLLSSYTPTSQHSHWASYQNLFCDRGRLKLRALYDCSFLYICPDT